MYNLFCSYKFKFPEHLTIICKTSGIRINQSWLACVPPIIILMLPRVCLHGVCPQDGSRWQPQHQLRRMEGLHASGTGHWYTRPYTLLEAFHREYLALVSLTEKCYREKHDRRDLVVSPCAYVLAVPASVLHRGRWMFQVTACLNVPWHSRTWEILVVIYVIWNINLL